MVVVNCMIGLITPPVGTVLFVGAAAMFIYLAHVLCVVLVRQGLGQDGLAAFALVLPLSLACGIGARYLWRSALKLPRLLVRKQREV